MPSQGPLETRKCRIISGLQLAGRPRSGVATQCRKQPLNRVSRTQSYKELLLKTKYFTPMLRWRDWE